MKERGEINIAIANYLENNFNDYTNLNRNDGNQVQNLDEIKHIIIGRWYYGLYLIAKDKLKLHSRDNVKHKVYKVYICKNGKKKLKEIIYGIWERINKKAKKNGITYDFEKNGIYLFQLRNKYEYRGTNVTDINFNMAKKIYEEMYNELQNL